eukprot:2357710-Rhodomonas_salina.1
MRREGVWGDELTLLHAAFVSQCLILVWDLWHAQPTAYGDARVQFQTDNIICLEHVNHLHDDPLNHFNTLSPAVCLEGGVLAAAQAAHANLVRAHLETGQVQHVPLVISDDDHDPAAET